MSNLVIVAIPDENDRVWKVSSEKIPHLTLLHLGDSDDVSNLEQIVLFVEHAANTTLRRFYLPVDRRGELGDAKADVLFFKKGRYDYKAIRDFRVQLLKDDNIRTAHDSVAQFEGPWNPHLTLGYPETPAKPDETDRDFGFYDVGFNKIAVWVDDFDGPEFLLKDYWDEWEALESVPMDVAMSDIREADKDKREQIANVGAEFLAHYGVKGMQWGVRRADAKFEKQAGSMKTFIKIHNKAADSFNKNDVDRINNDPKYKDADFTKDSPLRREYYKKHEDAFAGRLHESAMSMENKSGTRNYQVHFNDKGEFRVTTEDKVEHASDGSFVVKVKMEKGRIVEIEELQSENTLEQSVELGSVIVSDLLAGDALEHYGVKGMKWGTRKPPPSAVAAQATSVVPHGAKRKTKVKVEGGENHPASTDAIKVAQAKAKLRKSGTAALTNQELQDLQTRMNLERNVTQLVGAQSAAAKGKKFVKGLVGLNKQANDAANTVLTTQQIYRKAARS